MTKGETNKLLNTIKGYYNSQFFLDEDIIKVWIEEMTPYELEDSLEHLQEYLKEYPDIAPRPHTFKRGLLTAEEKDRIRNSKYTVECNLCHRFMPYEEYESHYGKCLDIQYLVSVAKQKGFKTTREELENQKSGVIDNLLKKYPPEKLTLEEAIEKI